MDVYADNCTDNKFYRLFALTDGAVTWDMFAIS